jgi:hypothetical protein
MSVPYRQGAARAFDAHAWTRRLRDDDTMGGSLTMVPVNRFGQDPRPPSAAR